MKNYLIGLVAISIAVLGLYTVNINHYLHLPQELTSRDYVYSKHFINFKFPFLHTQYDVQFSQEIKNLNSTRAVNKVLQEAELGDLVIFHLAGYGGEVESAFEIINNIRNSKAVVIMSVEAPVYSGHAYLAVNGDVLRVSDQAFLMFHNSTEYNLDCSKAGQQLDRAMTAEQHCVIAKENDMYLMAKLILRSQLLTIKEKVALLSGLDVYIQGEEANKRLNNHV